MRVPSNMTSSQSKRDNLLYRSSERGVGDALDSNLHSPFSSSERQTKTLLIFAADGLPLGKARQKNSWVDSGSGSLPSE